MTRRRRKKGGKSFKMIIQAKKVFVQLHDPYRRYGSLKQALELNPETVKEDWHEFSSTGEYDRYVHLLRCQEDGEITELKPHPVTVEICPQLKLPKNELRPRMRTRQHRVYTPDFSYRYNGNLVFEDFKGDKAQTQDTLRHSLFLLQLIAQGMKPKDIHFKVVTNPIADPSDEK